MQFASHGLSEYEILWVDKNVKSTDNHNLQVELVTAGFDISIFEKTDDVENFIEKIDSQIIIMTSSDYA